MVYGYEKSDPVIVVMKPDAPKHQCLREGRGPPDVGHSMCSASTMPTRSPVLPASGMAQLRRRGRVETAVPGSWLPLSFEMQSASMGYLLI